MIRKAKPEDAFAIHQAHMTSIQKLCAKDYSKQQIEAWGHRPFQKEKWIQSINNQFVWVVELDQKVEGVCAILTDKNESGVFGEIICLYLTPKAKGKGFGHQLIETAEKQMRLINIKKIKLNSTITAEKFYLKMGYVKSAKKTAHCIRDVKIDCLPMEKLL